MRQHENKWIAAMMAVVVVAIVAINLIYENDYTTYSSDGISYDKAKVVAILSERVDPSGDYENWLLGTQQLLVEFTNGVEKGEQVEVRNSLTSSRNIIVEEGTRIIIKADRPEGVAPYYSVYNYDRISGLAIIGVLFVLCMVGVAKVKGIKSVLGLGMSMYTILGFLIPAIYRGWSPIGTTIITVFLVSTISMLLLNGFCEKTYVAILSTMIGVFLSAIFYYMLQGILSITGLSMEEADQLIVISRSTGMNIQEILFSAVLIASLGAVIDTTMSIAAALYEIRDIHPQMPRKELFASGLSIGQDMIGTMCQTLILAFVGSSIGTLLVMISYGTQTQQLLNSDYLALEVVQAISGSLAIIFAVPITALLCTLSQSPQKGAGRQKN